MTRFPYQVSRTVDDVFGTEFKRAAAAACILVAAGVVAYSNSFDGVFVYDDLPAIQKNPYIRTLWPLESALSLPLKNAGYTVSRRPLLSLSFALNHAVFGAEPWGYHLVNLVIHVTSALLLFGVVRRTLESGPFRERWDGRTVGPALAVALLWMVHPLQTESVTYIAQRAESLVGMLYLCVLYAAIRGFRSRSAGKWYAASVAACWAGLGVKEVMLTAPVVVLLYDRTFVAASFKKAIRERPWFYAMLFGSWSVFAALSIHGIDDFQKDFTVRSPVRYALTQPGVILHYLRLSFWPHPLVLEYDWPTASSAADVIPAGCVLAALLGLTVWAFVRRSWLGFVGGSFFLLLAPSSSFAALSQNLVEHRMYLPLACVVVLVVIGADALLSRAGLPRGVAGKRLLVGGLLTLLVAAPLMARTHLRNAQYHDPVAFWSDNVKHRPNSRSAWRGLGDLYATQGRYDEALYCLGRSHLLDPYAADTHAILAKVLEQLGKPEDALHHYQAAVALRPGFAEAQAAFAGFLHSQGRLDEAVEHYQQALLVRPQSHLYHYNLGTVLAEQGRVDQAIAAFAAAVRIAPDYASAHSNLGVLYLIQGDRGRATDHFRIALQVDPNHANALNGLKLVREGAGD